MQVTSSQITQLGQASIARSEDAISAALSPATGGDSATTDNLLDLQTATAQLGIGAELTSTELAALRNLQKHITDKI